MMVLDIVAGVFLFLGFVLFAGATAGVLRFPDFYTRMHAAGKGDTLSSLFLITGLALYNLRDFSLASALVSGKLVLICIFLFIASPTAAHAIFDAGYEKGLRPWKRSSPDTKDEKPNP